MATLTISHVEGPHLLHLTHALYIPVARRTNLRGVRAGTHLAQSANVGLVNEVHMVGHTVDSGPLDGGASFPRGANLLNLWVICGNH